MKNPRLALGLVLLVLAGVFANVAFITNYAEDTYQNSAVTRIAEQQMIVSEYTLSALQAIFQLLVVLIAVNVYVASNKGE